MKSDSLDHVQIFCDFMDSYWLLYPFSNRHFELIAISVYREIFNKDWADLTIAWETLYHLSHRGAINVRVNRKDLLKQIGNTTVLGLLPSQLIDFVKVVFTSLPAGVICLH